MDSDLEAIRQARRQELQSQGGGSGRGGGGGGEGGQDEDRKYVHIQAHDTCKC